MPYTLARLIERHFLTLAVGFSALALLHPPLFSWIRPHISLGLGIIMFGMGLTLEFSDFARVARQWRSAGLGVALQYVLMPAIAWAVCLALNLPTEAALGVILVGCCPSGTASNVVAYFARADVPLSVVMTLASTLLAPLLMAAGWPLDSESLEAAWRQGRMLWHWAQKRIPLGMQQRLGPRPRRSLALVRRRRPRLFRVVCGR